MDTNLQANELDPVYSPAARAALLHDRRAAGWEWRATTRGADYFDPFFNALPQTAKHVLDVGCGSGRLLLQLAQRVECAVGLDLSETLLLLARDRQRAGAHPNVQLARGSIHAPPFALAAFDYIVSNNVMRLTNLPLALQQINRLLKPGGRLFVQDVGAQALFPKFGPLSHFYHTLQRFPSIKQLYGNRLAVQIAWDNMGLLKSSRARREPLWVGERAYAVYHEALEGCQIGAHAMDMQVIWDKPDIKL